MGYLKKALITTALICAPMAASADPITAFFVSLGATAGTAAILTNIAIGLTLSAIDRVIAIKTRARSGSSSTSTADARVNVRSEVAPRWQAGGVTVVGGSTGVFAEKDNAGNFWYIVAHADAELCADISGVPTAQLYFDDIPLTLSSGSVMNDEFCLASDGTQYNGVGTKNPVFVVWTIGPSASALYGAKPAAFTSAFPSLPADFLLAGVTYTLVYVRAMNPTQYRAAMRWRGALGLGEPSVALRGNWNRMYDPRNGAHVIGDPTTWTPSTGNAAIVWAWWRTTRYGRNRPMSEINWTKVADAANICDTTVLDYAGVTTKLYECGVAFPDNKPRQECEADILATMDAFVAYDENGAAYPVPGYYAAPSLTFTASRDILSAQTIITDDSETQVDGVIVNYIEPALNWTMQPSAPWQNPNWYSGSTVANYQVVDIPGCHNHNQAVRLAKAIGLRNAPTRKISVSTNIKGILAKNERAINLTYDATFNGVYEIVTPVEEEPSGVATSFSLVPMPSDKWTLGVGEEGLPPQAPSSLGLTDPLSTAVTAPAALSGVGVTPGAGSATLSFTTSNDVNQFSVAVYRGSSSTFSAAALVHTIYAGPNVSSYDTETGLAAGVYYWWAVPLSKTSAGPASGPYSGTVT